MKVEIRAKAEIRRFDIFAEWNRLKARERHRLSEGDARAYGLAVAKIVAARKSSGYEPGQVSEWKRRARATENHRADGEDFLQPGLPTRNPARLEAREAVRGDSRRSARGVERREV